MKVQGSVQPIGRFRPASDSRRRGKGAGINRLLCVSWISIALGLSACGSATADKGATADETADKNVEAAAANVTPPAAKPKVTIPAGTKLSIVLKDGVSTSSSTVGSVFSAAIAAPVVVDGKTVVDKGSSVMGRVVDVKDSGRVKGLASLSLVLTSVVCDGKTVPLETKTYVGVAKSTKKRDAGVIGGAAGIGAAIGAIAGGGKGAATGAAIGGAGGTGVVLSTRGEDVHYPPETRLSFVLAKAAEL